MNVFTMFRRARSKRDKNPTQAVAAQQDASKELTEQELKRVQGGSSTVQKAGRGQMEFPS